MNHQVYLSESIPMCELEAYHAVTARRASFDPSRVDAFSSLFDQWDNRPLYRTEQGVAIIPIEGYLDEKDSWELAWIGGTSYESVVKAITAARADSNVRAIILDVQSGGGNACGMSDAAETIRTLRGSKPIISIANSFCCSAAIGLATSADEFMVTQTAITGSIGVIISRVDATEYQAKLGIKTHVVHAGKEKAYGNPSVPMSDDEKARLQAMVQWFYDNFTKCIAANCGVDQSHVLTNWADARLFLGAQAVDAGLAKRVTTLTQLVAELGSQPLPATQKGNQSNVNQARNHQRIRPGCRIRPRSTE